MPRHRNGNGIAARMPSRIAQTLQLCSGDLPLSPAAFPRAIWVTFWLLNVSDRSHLEVCFCNSWNCCGCYFPLGIALTHEIRFSKPEPTNLKPWVSRFCQSYSTCASVLKTGATHLYLREVLWKWTNLKYAPVLTATGKSIWEWPSEIYYNIQPAMPTATHRAAKIELNVDCVLFPGALFILFTEWSKVPVGRNNIWPWMCYYQIITLPYPLLANKG